MPSKRRALDEDGLEIASLRKSDGPLSKRIELGFDGTLISDGSACTLTRGTASRFRFTRLTELAELIEDFGSNQALTLGALRPDLPARVEVVTERVLNGASSPNAIARTTDYFVYRSGEPALALVDYDLKGMPKSVADRITELGGLWPSLLSVMPWAADAGRLARGSSSAGLFRTDTGQRLPGTGGIHLYLAVEDGDDIERFLRTLHARCWLAGLGSLMVGRSGQLLERSIVERVVGSPERLVFEGAPILVRPLGQDAESRRSIASEGKLLDTIGACPPLSFLE
jgi:hypothetical protein